MKLSTVKKICVTYIVNHFLAGTYAFSLKRRLLKSIGYEIGENSKIVGPIYNTGKLVIGSNTWIGRNFTVEGNGRVHIGDNCDIAPEVAFQTGGHLLGNENRRAGKGVAYNIEVGNGTWMGARSTVVGNTKIGTGCFVTACACVAEDIENNNMVGGVPAKVIRKL